MRGAERRNLLLAYSVGAAAQKSRFLAQPRASDDKGRIMLRQILQHSRL
jgi:hypothetical protein